MDVVWDWLSMVLFPEVAIGVILFLSTLSIVYTFGRLLNILRKDITKNILALLCASGLSYFYTTTFIDTFEDVKVFWWTVFFRACISILLYVWVGFKAFDRVDHFLDKKIAED